jgi:biopolymer transport protein ExbB
MTLDAVEKNPSWRLEENPGLVEAAADRLYHKLTPLSVIYTIAPLMGLLGTILGMSDTFFEFAQMGQNREISQLSTGINQALITTMWGLMIAIPAYVFSSVLRHKVFAYEKDILPSRLAEILNACRQYAGSGQAGDPVGFDPGARKPAAPSSPDAASAKGA